MTEMHALLGTLRDPEDEQLTQVEHEHGAAGIAGLVEAATETGMSCVFRIVGTPRPVPAVIDTTLFRVAQEALSNARKHGDANTEVDVRLRFDDGDGNGDGVGRHDDVNSGGSGGRRSSGGSPIGERAVELEISNTGGQVQRRRSGGFGLIGMAERVDAAGGTLYTGPRRSGGFLVRARFPLTPRTD
ncbi:MAG: sensor histidine kinase [Mycetocola sp.]